MRLTATAVLALLLIAAGLFVWRSPWNYAAQDRETVAAGVSATHPAGTDELGRDRAVRTAAALLLGMAGAIAASTLSSLAAVGLGSAAAFAPDWLGRALLYVGDVFLTLPWLFLLMMVRSAVPLNIAPAQSFTLTFFLLGVLGAPAFLRLHYAQTRRLRRAPWLLSARAAGLRPWQRARGLLPHLRPLLAAQFLLYIPACLMAEANLGTLGLGISEPLPSWGSMLENLQSAAFLSNSRLNYLPIVLLILVLTMLELLLFTPKEQPK